MSSQMQQDIRVIEFFDNLENLFYIDIGANDGKNISNTYILEKKFGWKGICSEPLPSAFTELKKSRNAICDNHAVYSQSNITLKFSCAGLFSGITDDIIAFPDVKNCPNIEVKTITLDKLLLDNNAPNVIHYMSLDTEGSEFEILKSIDYKKYKILLLHVEHNGLEPIRKNIKNLLENNNFIFKDTIQDQDDEYIHVDNIIGQYYKKNDNTIKMEIKHSESNDFFVLLSKEESECKYEPGVGLVFNNLGIATVIYNRLEFDNGIIWFKK